jgi:RNA polymerase sigma-70 factor (ECF subfamily)
MELNFPQTVVWSWEAGFLSAGLGDVMTTNINTQAVAQMYRDYGAVVYRRALRLLANPQDAEEATQEVFVRVMRTEAGYSGKGELIGWLYRITTHYCLNRIRDKRRRQDLFQLHVAPAIATSASTAPVDMVMMRWLLANADERQAQAAIYVFVDGMSYDEAAPLLGVSKRTVGNLLERFQTWCLEQLRTAAASGESAGLPYDQSQATARS